MKIVHLYECNVKTFVTPDGGQFRLTFIWIRPDIDSRFCINFDTEALLSSSCQEPIIDYLDKSYYGKLDIANYEDSTGSSMMLTRWVKSRHPISWVSFKCYKALLQARKI
jgi:hypothetical protein